MASKQIPSINIELHQQTKQALTQRLIMSAHMQQAIHLLQLPLLEIESFIEEQVAQNPVLETFDESEIKTSNQFENESEEPKEDNFSKEGEDLVLNENNFEILKHIDEEFDQLFTENDIPAKRTVEEEKYKSYQENSITADTNLYQKLIQEAHETFEDSKLLEIAEILIGYIDGAGFLNTSLAEIATLHNLEEKVLEEVLKEIQTFEPFGIGANSLQESLLIQLRCLNKEHTLAYQIIKDHYENMLNNRLLLIQKALKCPLQDIQKAIKEDIAPLDLHPGARFSDQKVQVLVPDVTLKQEGNMLIVDVNRDWAPNIRLNRKYLRMLEDPDLPVETKNYIKRNIFSAKWLVRNLQQRYSTIEKIAASLAKKQYDFFMNPDGKLVPLTMRTLAEELNVHESTIARTVANKYIDTPRGLLALRQFFTTEFISDQGQSLSSKTVQDSIKEIIQNEDKQSPLSDEKISVLLKEKGIPCARRTIAKYRNLLGIGNTLQRKKF